MIYCPNPDCIARQNTDKIMTCQTCKTSLVINGRYQLIEPLRKISLSGCAEVFTVQDLFSTTKVMKILRVGDPKLLEMFDREAQVLQKLNHPSIPRMEADGYFSFQTAAGLELKCLVMEKIAGVNLGQWLQENHYCPPDLALQWLKQLVDILEYLHQKDFFHRDIKPTNIILKPDGQIALVDFGAVRQITNTVWGEQDLTLVHTPAYAPPEQLKGQAVPQSDFYALGRTFVHLLTGQSPLNFPEDHGRLQWRNPNPKHFPKLVADLVDQLMTTMVEERPQNTTLIQQQIEHIERKQARRWQRLFIYVSVAASILLAIIITNRYLTNIEKPPALKETANAYVKRGSDRRKKGDIRNAQEDFQRAIQLDPNHYEAYAYRGIGYTDFGLFKEALVDFNQAIILRPDFAHAHKSRGIAKCKLGDREGATSDFKKSFELFNLERKKEEATIMEHHLSNRNPCNQWLN